MIFAILDERENPIQFYSTSMQVDANYIVIRNINDCEGYLTMGLDNGDVLQLDVGDEKWFELGTFNHCSVFKVPK